MKVYECLNCKTLNLFNAKSIGINRPHMLECTQCHLNTKIIMLHASCCTITYKFIVIDLNNNEIAVKHKSYPKK